MKARTRSEIEDALELAKASRDEAPEEAIRRLRYCFPDIDDGDRLAMALRHPEVKRERAYWRRRIRAHRRALAACKARRKARR
jgi:hypothetical protein